MSHRKNIYKIIDKDALGEGINIGNGAFGKVSLVYDEGKPYAMKEPLENNMSHMKDILREIDILCRLDHPAVIKLYGYNLVGTIVILTEYMKNGDLTNAITKRGQDFNITKKMICAYGIAKGLEYCHSKRIIHRDLKPDNILLNENDEPCITDFGLSKVTDGEDQLLCQSNIVGTPLFQPPEMKTNQLYGFLSDVYAYGLILFFIFTGYSPEMMDMISEEEINEWPKIITELICRSTEFDEKERYPFGTICQRFEEELKNYPEDQNCIGLDIDALKNYINKLKGYQSRTDIDDGLYLNDESQVKIDYPIYLTEKGLTAGARYVTIGRHLSPDLKIVIDSDRENNNNYLLRLYNGINENHFIHKIDQYSKLVHPAILKIKGIALSDFENTTLVTKEVVNKSLAEAVRYYKENTDPSWNINTQMKILYGISRAMEYLHSKGFKNSSLCPENVFLDDNLYPYITNFELDLPLYDDDDESDDEFDNLPNEPLINTNCIAPEIYKNQNYDEKADIFAFSIIMYYIFTGEYPSMKKSNKRNPDSSCFSASIKTIPSTVPDLFHKLIKSCAQEIPGARPTFQKISEEISIISDEIEGLDEDNFKKYCSKIDNEHNQVKYCENVSEILNKRLMQGPSLLIARGQEYEKSAKCKEDLESASACYLKAFEKGDMRGSYYLGLLYKKPDFGFGPSFGLARKFFQAAKESDDPEIAALATQEFDLINQQIDQNQNLKHSSIEMLQKLDQTQDNFVEATKEKAEQGDPDSMHMYGLILYQGFNVPVDYEKSLEYFKKAAEKGDVKSMCDCGKMLRSGKGVNKNPEEALKYFKDAANLQNKEALFYYASMALDGEGMEKDEVLAFKLFKESAEKGFPSAMNSYAIMLEQGVKGVQPNIILASIYFKKAADRGSIAAMKNFADFRLQDKLGLKANPNISAKYYKMAADSGDAEAMYQYALLKEEEEKEEAFEYYKKAIERYKQEDFLNSPCALYRLGMLHLNGKGTEKNVEEALSFLKKAGDYNSFSNDLYCFKALNQLNSMYFNGDEVDKAPEKATEYFTLMKNIAERTPADANSPDCLFLIGSLLYNGKGVEMNKEEAAHFYEKAANLKHLPSIKKLIKMYRDGDGVKADPKKQKKYTKMKKEIAGK